jgi:hypothetical protein
VTSVEIYLEFMLGEYIPDGQLVLFLLVIVKLFVPVEKDIKP